MDAMTLVQKYGKPDIFLTMTCNPNWPKIKEHLIDKEEAQNRPDLLARVFHAKLEQLKDELLKKCIFGEVSAYTYVIEYQKRGLPHTHFLLILKSKFKMYTPEEYDKIVCAEIPNKEKNEHLYNLVIKHMLHGPCGSLDPTSVCMRKNGTCKNNFPKNFCEETIQTLNAYPEYRRRDDGVQIKIKSALLDNRWVVQYNPYLLAKFDCHLNVEICSTIKAVKYIYKYIYKGHDRTNFCVVNNKSDSEIDEIKQYVSARWVSPSKAAWRIFRFCGIGKTFLYKALLADVRSKDYLALATATSGIAASILPGGKTAHPRFKIPIDIFDGATCRVSKQTSLAAMIKEAKLVIWDEAPMSKKAAIEALDDLLRDLMNSEEIFGGKVVVLGGDFRQTLPVVRKGTKAEMINACLINSPLWHKLEKLQLTENMRAKLDPSFTQFLLKIGDETQQTDENDIVKLPSSIIVNYNNETDAIEKLINIVYPEFKDPSKKLHCPQNRAILTTKNNFVDKINDELIKKFPGDLTEYLSYDETLNENHQSEYIDLLNTLTPSNLPAHRLLFKLNAPIILLRNLDPAEGLCNGTRLIIKSLSKNVICAKIAVGDFCGKEVFIHRISMQPPSDEQYPVPYKRT
ncbi:uncharacterized protein [Coffea arabica]|uniref:ATP-dependent DNA helicase n=1 Tax=Coffea arabica TaxID=13443 RepID=A0ABM4W2N9_COFAR